MYSEPGALLSSKRFSVKYGEPETSGLKIEELTQVFAALALIKSGS